MITYIEKSNRMIDQSMFDPDFKETSPDQLATPSLGLPMFR